MQMILPLIAIVVGLALLVWSADRFVEGAASAAGLAGMPSLLIGMLVIGFGTSAPELVVSALSALQGNPGIALGNAYGSNIANIALILGVTALVSPITVQSKVLKKELPLLLAVTALAAIQAYDGELSLLDAIFLLLGFAVIMGWSIYTAARSPDDPLAREAEQELSTGEKQRAEGMSTDPGARPGMGRPLFWLVLGLILLIVSSRIVVWGAVELARGFGVSDLLIGLTIIAIGTSLPELASSLMATRKGEHELALGNVIGSNLFNTLMVVGIAGAISPMKIQSEILSRDIAVMAGLTVAIFMMGFGFGKPGRINRIEAAGLVTAFVVYTGYLAWTAF